MKAPALVAVAEPVPRAGGIVWWRLSGDVILDELRAEWSARGLPETALPTPPGPAAALTRAMAEHRGRHVLARPLGNRGEGHALVYERLTAETMDLEFSTGLKVRLDPVGRPRFEPTDHPLVTEIKAAYNRHLELLSPADVGTWLVKLVRRVDGIPLRDTGGVYFVPYTRVPEWTAMVTAIHAASAHRINDLPALRAEDAVSSILDALTAEAEGVAAELEEDLASELTAKKAGNRVTRCEQTEAKVARYEALLGIKADALRTRLEGLRAQLAVAAIQEDSDLAGA